MVLKLKSTLLYIKIIIWRFILIGKPKIFVISYQKSGTKSVGKFFKDHNFRVASHGVSFQNEWNLKWFKGDFDAIIKSPEFKSYQVFEDDPWFFPDFYKFLYHKFPKSKFVFFKRDVNSWFDSMKAFKKGKSLGNTYIHSKIYRREHEYYNMENIPSEKYKGIKDELLKIEEYNRDHYVNLYEIRIKEIIEFFEEMDSNRFFYANLEDTKKWIKLGEFLNIYVNPNYDAHENININK